MRAPLRERQRNRRGGKRRIAIALGVAIVALLFDVTVVDVLWTSRAETEERSAARDADLARVLSEYVLRSLQGIDLLLGVTANEIREDPGLLTPGNPRLVALLGQRVAAFPAVSGIGVVDARGELLGDSRGNGGPGRPFNFADRPYFIAHRDDPRLPLHVDVPRQARAVGEPFIAVSRALHDRDGGFAGVMFVALLLDPLQRFLASLDLGAEGVAAIWRADGALLVRQPAPGDRIRGRPAAFFGGSASASGVRTLVDPEDGMLRQVTHRAVPGFPLVVSVAASPDETLAGWRRNAWRYGIMAGVANAAVIGCGVAVALAWRRRDAAGRALAEQEALMRLISDELPLFVVLIDRNHRCRFANRTAAAWLARPADALLGTELAPLVPEDMRPPLRDRMIAALGGEPQGFEAQWTFPDGVERWIEGAWRPHRDANGDVVGVVVQLTDLSTERRETLAALHATRAELTDVLDGLDQGVALWDDEDRLVVCNRRYHAHCLAEIGTPIFPGQRFDVLARSAALVGSGDRDAIETRIAHHRRADGVPMMGRLIDGRVVQLVETRTSSGGTLTRVTDEPLRT